MIRAVRRIRLVACRGQFTAIAAPGRAPRSVADARQATGLPSRRRLAIAPPGRRRHPPRIGRHGSGERGAVTAELALALPLLLAVTTALVWLVAVAIGQVRTVDAARETARALARGDDQGAAVAVGERIAPGQVEITVSRQGDRVVVRARGRMSGPGGLFGALPGAHLDAEAVAVLEEEAGGGS